MIFAMILVSAQPPAALSKEHGPPTRPSVADFFFNALCFWKETEERFNSCQPAQNSNGVHEDLMKLGGLTGVQSFAQSLGFRHGGGLGRIFRCAMKQVDRKAMQLTGPGIGKSPWLGRAVCWE